MKILILALSGIGDALMFTPALTLVRKHFPNAQIDTVVMFKGVEDIYRRTGLFNNIFFFDFMKQGAVKSLAFVLKMRGKYEYSVNVYPANRKEYNGIGFLFGAKKRGAVKYIRMENSNLGFLNTHRVTEDDKIHNVEENIAIVKKLLGFEDTETPPLLFPLSAEDIDFAGQFMQLYNISGGKKLIGFHAGCSTMKNHINRRWEPEKFIELGKRLLENQDTFIAVFGGPEEDELKQGIVNGIGSERAIFVKSKNLAQSAALIKRCSLFVTNDSSLMHVASAMQRKVVAIIGPTNIHYIHPWKTEYKIASLNLECAPCFFYSPKPLSCNRSGVKYKCIKELTVGHVIEAIKMETYREHT